PLDAMIPPELEAICLRAMAREPGDRYASARALADDVQAHLEDRPVAARPDGPARALGRWSRRHRAAALATAAIALVVGVGGPLWRRAAARREHEAIAAPARAERDRARAS